MIQVTPEQKMEVINHYQFTGELLSQEPYGSGHINDTFLLVYDIERMGRMKVILQRMNKDIFTKPEELMENVVGVTSYLRERIIENGGDPERETLNVIPTPDGAMFYKDSKGDYWRAYKFITDALGYDKVENPDDFYQSAVSFGNFQRLLADYPAETLHETIPLFHNTTNRYRIFRKALQDDLAGRAAGVPDDIRFALDREQEAGTLCSLLDSGELPLRVTHNDTKLNNVLFDRRTRKALCVLDLDTVMPGSSLYDYGDSIRFGAATAAEDEKDLSKMGINLHLFQVYTAGYLAACKSLTPKELELLPLGAKIITLELAVRFLTDYLDGDRYFRVAYPEHNLVRARAQMKLVADMEAHWDEMQAIVAEEAAKRN